MRARQNVEGPAPNRVIPTLASGAYGGLAGRNCGPRVGAKERFTVQLDCGLTSRTRTAPRRSRVKLLLLATSLAMLIAPAAAFADATLSPGLSDRAAANPDAVFKIIVQGEPGQMSKTIGKQVDAVAKAHPGSGIGMKRGFLSIDGVSAELTGEQILRLAGSDGIVTI